ARKLGAMAGERRHPRHDLIDIGADAVIRHDGCETLEPEGAHLGQHGTLVRHRLSHHDVERADPIAGDEQQRYLVNLVNLANLPATEEREREFALDQHARHTSTSAVAVAGAAAVMARIRSGRTRSRKSSTCCGARPTYAAGSS